MSKRLFSIPRKFAMSVAARPYWDIVRKHGRSHASMVKFICNIGGYADHGDRFAIEFNVKAGGASVDVDHLWMVATTKTDYATVYSEMTPEEQTAMEQAFRDTYAEHAMSVFDWGLEEARDGWTDTDMPFETWLGERIDWSWEFAGRCGGHLVMTECEGINLRCSDEELYDNLMEMDGGAYVYDTERVRKLFIICVQNTVELTTQKIEDEVEYRAAWRIWTLAEEEYDRSRAYAAEREALSEAAGRVADSLASWGDDTLESFQKICALAGVKLPD